MNIEDQVVALFAKANPVPSLELLDPIEPVSPERLEDRFERSSRMSEIGTIEPELSGQSRKQPVLGWVAAGVMTLAAVAGIIALSNQDTDVVAAPVDIAESFMEARIVHDAEAMSALLADDALLVDDQVLDAGQTGPDVLAKGALPGLVEFERITGRTYTFESCVEESLAQARCTVVLEDDMSRALGVDPLNAHFLFDLSEGKIDEVVFVWDGERTYAEVAHPVGDWMYLNHAEDADIMLDQPLKPESLALWEQHVPEFVAAQGS